MPGITPEARQRAVQRLFLVQLAIIVVAVTWLLICLAIESWRGAENGFGFFWFAFVAGCLGSSVGHMHRARQNEKLLVELSRSWTTLLMPHLYGGIMAGVAYLLFMSGILSGSGEKSLLTSNLFPDFTQPQTGTGTTEAAAGAAPGDGDPIASISAYIATRPRTIADMGRLMIWCFIAGYSERFVFGILRQLESPRGGNETKPVDVEAGIETAGADDLPPTARPNERQARERSVTTAEVREPSRRP